MIYNIYLFVNNYNFLCLYLFGFIIKKYSRCLVIFKLYTVFPLPTSISMRIAFPFFNKTLWELLCFSVFHNFPLFFH